MEKIDAMQCNSPTLKIIFGTPQRKTLNTADFLYQSRKFVRKRILLTRAGQMPE